MQTSEVLYTAADLIERRGWTTQEVANRESKLRGHCDPWGNRDGSSPLCLEGGIFVAAGLDWTFEAESCPAGRAVREYLDLESSRLWLYNDAPGRTQAEVIATLRAAAVIEAAKEQAAVDTPAVSLAPVRSGL